MLAPDDVRPHCCFIPQGIFRESRQTRGDEDLEHTESMMAIEQLFDQLDKDHSGIIAYDEWENFMVQFIRRRCVCCAPPEWLFAVQMGSILNHAKAQMNHELAHQAAFHQHSIGAPLSNPTLKRCPEFTRERCERFQRATLVSPQLSVSSVLTRVHEPEVGSHCDPAPLGVRTTSGSGEHAHVKYAV